MRNLLISSVVLFAAVGIASAETVEVGAIGDHGWYSDDTRLGDGTNVVGTNYTHAPVPGQTPTAADDTVIAQRFTFVAGPTGASNGAMKIAHPDASSIKSTISVINTNTGLASGDWHTNFSAKWRKYHTGGTTRGASLKIGVQSTEWSNSQSSFSATRSGEPVWDLILVNNQTLVDDAWVTNEIDGAGDAPDGTSLNTFKIYPQAGNSYFGSPQDLGYQTLQWWANTTELAVDLDGDDVKDSGDYTWGEVLFGQTAQVTNFQFGAGSGAGEELEYFDWVETSLLNGGDRVDFVPEPATMSLLGLGGLALLQRRRSRKA